MPGRLALAAIPLLLVVAICGCAKDTTQVRSEVLPHESLPAIRGFLTDAGECEALAYAVKDRFKPTDKEYKDTEGAYTKAFVKANGYIRDLTGTVEINRSLKLAKDDYQKSAAREPLQSFKADAQKRLGVGLDATDAIVGAGKIATFVLDVQDKINQMNKRNEDAAVSDVVQSLQRAQMAPFGQLNQEYFKNKYKANTPGATSQEVSPSTRQASPR